MGETGKVEATIAKKAQGALVYSLLGGLGFTAIVTSPLAFIYATQALQLIQQHQVGERYRNNANIARVIAIVVVVFYGGIALCVLGPLLLGSALGSNG